MNVLLVYATWPPDASRGGAAGVDSEVPFEAAYWPLPAPCADTDAPVAIAEARVFLWAAIMPLHFPTKIEFLLTSQSASSESTHALQVTATIKIITVSRIMCGDAYRLGESEFAAV